MANPIPNLFRVPELKEKILFTLFILLVYRLGAHITVPGLDVNILREQFGQLGNTLFGIYDMFVGGGLSRATILALGIMPYISASIMFQLLAAVFPTIEKLQKEGEEGRKKLTQWTRYTTVGLSAVQAYGYAVSEDLQIREGHILNPRLSTYLIPGIQDIPERVEPVILEIPDPLGPWGVRGVGEMPFLPLAPAITAALYDATGVWFDEIPLTPGRVVATLRGHGLGVDAVNPIVEA